MHKDKSNRLYSAVIVILIISILYQLMYFIYHSWTIKEAVPTDASIVHEEIHDESTDLTDSSGKGQEKEEEEEAAEEKAESPLTVEASTMRETKKNNLDDTNLFIYLLQRGLPSRSEKVEYGLIDMVKDISNIDISDPKILISSQMPIISEYEIDDVEITEEEQKEIYNITASKPLNDNEVLEGNIGDEPLVLLYTTHTTESFISSSETKIDYISPYRSKNEEHNMTAVSGEIKKVLEEEYGIPVILDKTIHDYPNYNLSYSNSLKTVRKILKENPSIKYVFDIHRDGLADTEKNKEVYKTVVNEESTAKVMMVVGMNHENSSKNVAFSDEVYKIADEMYPSLLRPTVKRSTAKYNQFVSDNAILFEVGSNLSTLEESKYSARYLGKALGQVIIQRE